MMISRRPLTLLTLLAFILQGFAFADDPKPPRPEPQDAKKDEKPEAAKEKPKADDKAKDKKKPDKYLAVVNGEVHTITGPVMRNAIVLIKNGKIDRVGVDVKIPEGAKTLDVKGLKVYPGLVAINTQGIVGREPLVDSFDPFSLNVVLALAGGLTTVVSGDSAAKLTYGTVDGHLMRENLFVRLNYASTTASARQKIRNDLKKARDYLRAKADYDKKKAEQKDEKPAPPEAGRGGGSAGGGAPAEPKKDELKEPSKQGVNEQYLDLFNGKRRAWFNANEAGDLLAVCDLVREFQFRAIIEGAVEGWVVPDAIGRSGASVICNPRRKVRRSLLLERASGSNIQNPSILYQHGVPIACLPNSPGISMMGIAGKDLLTPVMDAIFAVRGGLPPKAAEESITITPARMIGIDDRVGSIEEGKDGDLIVTDGELLDYRTFVQWAVVNGEIAYDKAKDTLFSYIRPLSTGSSYIEPPEEPAFDEQKKAEPAKPEEKKAEGEQPAEGDKKDAEKKPEGDKPEEKKPEGGGGYNSP